MTKNMIRFLIDVGRSWSINKTYHRVKDTCHLRENRLVSLSNEPLLLDVHILVTLTGM